MTTAVPKAGPSLPRPLTHAELRAAEAAFRGLPRDPGWPKSAQAIYDGIMARTGGRNIVEEAGLEDCAA